MYENKKKEKYLILAFSFNYDLLEAKFQDLHSKSIYVIFFLLNDFKLAFVVLFIVDENSLIFQEKF